MREMPALHVRCAANIGALQLHVDFTAAAAWTVLFGPSGSGKSSILRLIAGLWTPPDAAVTFGRDAMTHIPTHRREIGLVAQQPALFPHLDVLGNVQFGSAGTSARAEEVLELFHLQHLRHAAIPRLSGGERQRVALARALAAAPRLLLLDEVFTGMHMSQRNDLLHRVDELCRAKGIPVLSVTHDAIEASLVAGDVIKLEAGRVREQGKAEDVLATEREALRLSLAATSLLRSEVSE